MIAKSILYKGIYTCALVLLLGGSVSAQNTPAETQPPAPDAGTSTDLFLMPGSDFDRPGLVPRANLNIGIGHTFGFLKKDPIGDELTVAYTYENAGTHGFFHTNFGSRAKASGVARSSKRCCFQ